MSEDWDLGSDKADDPNEEAQQDSGQEETRCLAFQNDLKFNARGVGKKLSDMTSRRVIVLILVMLFCSFIFTVDSWGVEFVLSGTMGPNLVYE